MGMLSGTKSPAPCREAPVYEVKLERVLGLTVPSNAALDCDPNSELIAYPAGCTVVLFNPRKNRQCHVLNAPRKTITCVAFSADGRYLATGECGHAPSVRVWDLHDLHTQGAQQVAEFPGHKYGINCVAFSPSHKYVVSVGSQHDMIVNVWDWRANIKVASNKVSSKVKAVSFAENGNYFVTVGNRHVKFWYLEYSRAAKYKEPVPLMGRSAILGEQRNNYFCDVACGRGESGDSTYAITKSGLLCEFNNRRLLDKWVELRTTSANCMSVGEHHIFIGCADGIVRCFSPLTLQFITTLPRTHYLGVDVAQGLNISHMASHPNNAKYPDAIALAYDSQNQKLTCVYNDHSLYVWDVRDIKRVGKSHSFLYHSACIWGVEMYPVGVEEGMPPGSFVTCSSDDTIRFWNLDPNTDTSQDPTYRRNIYSNELMKVLYVDPEMTYLKDLDLSTAEKTDSSYDGRNGVRSIRISPDGKHLASGDRAGNIRINEVRGLPEVCRIEAHDAEVLCLEYTRQDSGHKLLASASRDRLIHVFSVDEDYNFVQTLDDHSSSITAVRFLNAHRQLQMVSCGADKSIIFRQLTGSPGGNNIQFARGHNAAGKTTLYDMEVDCGQKHILTACQDRNIRVYNVTNGKHSKTFKGSVGEDGSLIKVVLDPSGIFVATSCTDKTLCVYDYYSGECMATMLGHSELVTGLRFTNDCKRLISASGDGCIFVWKVPHDMVVTMQARLAQQAARAGRRSNKLVNGIQMDNDGFGPPPPEMLDPNANSVDHADYRFSVGQLPLWAKKQIKDDLGDATHTNLTNNRPIEPPKGRWAQRLDATGITVKSVYDSDSVIPFPLQQEKRADSDGSKDSSIDSGTEIRHYSDFRRETMLINKQGLQSDQRDEFLPCPESMHELLNGEESKQVSIGKVTMSRGNEMSELHRNRHHTDDSSIGSYKYEDMESTEHDGDVEDYSEGEGESTEPEHSQRLIYYPAAEETTSVYTVNAMDVEELRRSQRRLRKNQRPERLSDLPLVSPSGVSGSQDSDDDDEEVSTPSADTAERNLMSMLSVSSESLDIMGQREKYLKNTFDSLSGAEQDKDHYTGKKSISSQYHGRLSTTPRNTAVINAAWQSRAEPETSRKREELKKRIEETRRKLQSVGYRSNLKSSQSIQDLSRYPEKERRNGGPHRMLRPPGIAVDSDDGGTDPGGAIRRACSLSDLANPSPRRAPVQVSGKVSNQKSSSASRTLPRPGFKTGSTMTRSSSVGVLNQSDSESDLSLSHHPTPATRMNGLMRPTISSQNKMTGGVGGKTRMPVKRGLSGAFSSMNLSQVGNNEDSSSEEISSVGKPRQRSSSIDRSTGPPLSLPPGGHSAVPHRRAMTSATMNRFGGERDLVAPVPPPRPTRLRTSSSNPTNLTHQLDPSPQELPVKDTDSGVDLASAPLSHELISSITEQLMRTADTVVQLHKRLAMESTERSSQDPLLQGLEGAVGEAQRTLRLIAGGATNGVPVTNGLPSSDPVLANKLQDLVATGGGGGAVTMMQQYSDLLLSLVQQRVSAPASANPGQSPTSPSQAEAPAQPATD